ncbi:hypothetical protein AVEN_261323-1 [Araneus ventricosus]|uniref:Uncharacterized protein n=1 Tax=Araneus ventricosus TaxID=182803 RepID=A0A4Y2QCM2_ARAVE|nr:hypothetical protein AVEN_261323-1 [Araneus ventricosus]
MSSFEGTRGLLVTKFTLLNREQTKKIMLADAELHSPDFRSKIRGCSTCENSRPSHGTASVEPGLALSIPTPSPYCQATTSYYDSKTNLTNTKIPTACMQIAHDLTHNLRYSHWKLSK